MPQKRLAGVGEAVWLGTSRVVRSYTYGMSRPTGAGRRPKLSPIVVKALFAVSGNLCAFIDIGTGRGCEEKLTDPQWMRVKAEIAHIRGLHPGSARHDPAFENPNSFGNLLLLCPNHHAQIDDLEPDKYTVEALEAMKERSETRAEEFRKWSTEVDLDRYAGQLVSITMVRWTSDAMLNEARATEEMKRILTEAMNRLPDREKIVMSLYYYERLTIAEIAEVLGVSTSTVSRIHTRTVLQLADQTGFPDIRRALRRSAGPDSAGWE